MQGAVSVVNNMSPCSEFSSRHSKQVFPISKKLHCQCTNRIYLMECYTCKQSYFRYTTSNLRDILTIKAILRKVLGAVN